MRRRGIRNRISNTLVVHTTDAQSIRGVLIGDYADCLVLAAAVMLRGSDTPAPLGGDVLILRERVSFIQDVTVIERAPQVLPSPPGR